MFIVTSRKFYDVWTAGGGGGVDYLNACQGDKVKCVIEGYFYWASINRHVIFDNASKTITLYSPDTGQNDSLSFITDGFKLGDTFAVTGSVSNNTNFTIASITDRVITTVVAPVSEDSGATNLYGTTKITALDYYYNLIENSAQIDFDSKTDIGTQQKYTIGGLDASVPGAIYFNIGTDSFGWVTDGYAAGVSTETFIEAVSIAAYKQSFRITQIFRQTVMWTKDVQSNFQNKIIPNNFLNGKALRHICKIDGKFDYNTPVVAHTGSITTNGAGSWYNQSSIQTRRGYSIDSITYQNYATSEFLDQLQGDIVNLVTMIVKSKDGEFAANTSKFLISHFQCPTIDSEYINTNTNLLENIKYDEAFATSDQAAINGINYGTDYQSITNVQVVNFSVSQVVITFRINYSTAIKTYLKNKAINDRFYFIGVECQDILIATTKGVDRINLIADFNDADYDVREPNNFGLVDYIHSYFYPNWGVFENNTVKGYEGEPSYVEIPFWVETAVVNGITPTIQNIELQIVSTKAGQNDFVIESKFFNLSTIRKLNNKQTVNIIDFRNFILAEDSPWNRADIIRNPDGDNGTKISYMLRYGFVLRYEDWIEVVQSAVGNTYDIFKDVETVVHAWKRFNTGNGWVMKLRLNSQIKGYSGFVTNFTTDTSFTILDSTDAPEDGNNFKVLIQYFTVDGIEIDGILKDAPTRLVGNFICGPTIFPANKTVLNGFCFVDDIAGSIFSRRLASTDIASESDSPFSIDTLPVLSNYISQQVENNLRMTIFQNRIIFDTLYTPIENDKSSNKLVWFKLGYNNLNILLQENGSAILQENGDYILLEP